MAPFLDFPLQILLGFVAYGTGKVVAVLVMPGVEIEPFERQRSAPRWKWRGFTYRNGNRRFLYTESVQLLGIAFWLSVGVFVFAVAQIPR